MRIAQCSQRNEIPELWHAKACATPVVTKVEIPFHYIWYAPYRSQLSQFVSIMPQVDDSLFRHRMNVIMRFTYTVI